MSRATAARERLRRGARAPEPSHVATATARSVAADVIGRTGEKLRVRVRGDGSDLFARDRAVDRLGVKLGSIVLVTAEDGGDREVVKGTVIGLPDAGVVELETRGEIWLRTKTVEIEKWSGM